MQNSLRFVVLSVVLLFSVSVFSAGTNAASQKDKMSKSKIQSTAASRTPASEETIALYKSKCASCHGTLGEGSPKMAKMFKLEEEKLKLTGDGIKKASDAVLVQAVLQGKGKMPGYKGKISEDDAKKLVQYMRTFK
ncbi:MAG: cytochrome c [Deltaproteobacteria bacterium]|nr:cytochrome c [Deltaproteobacteria bacterium]